MKEKKPTRKLWLTIRLSEDEQQLLNKLMRDSTCSMLSDYVRKVVLNKPINIKYRNASIDDFLTDMLALKKELNYIGHNFNQAVHVLHTLERIGDFQHWIITNEQDKARLFKHIETISFRIESLYTLWSQK